MIREKDKVKCRNGREGTVIALLGWVDGKPTEVAVRHTDDPVYPKDDVVYKLHRVMPL